MDGCRDQELVVQCLTYQLRPDHPLPAPSGRLDWTRVHELVSGSGLARLFCRLVQELPELWPKPFQERLRVEDKVRPRPGFERRYRNARVFR